MIYYSNENIIVRDIETKDSINIFMWSIDKEVNKFDPRPIPDNPLKLVDNCK